jgi:hypothetical protein
VAFVVGGVAGHYLGHHGLSLVAGDRDGKKCPIAVTD